MANNIKIIGNILNTSTVNRYSEADLALITSKRLQEDFGAKEDYIEYYVYDAAENLLNVNYNYLSYKLPTGSALIPGVNNPPNTTGEIQTTNVGIESTLTTTGSLYPIIEIDPIKDLQDLGYSSGEFIVKYNFFQNKVSDYIDEALFIKEISRDRTEIRLGSISLTDEQIESGSLALIEKINTTEDYYVDYLLNFGNNEQYVAVNVALNKDPDGYEILFKLYQPLPLSVQEKQTLWVIEEQSTPYIFDINLDRLVIPPPPPTLRGPNFDIEIEGQGTISTQYNNYSNLISSLQSLQSSSYNQIQSLLTSQSIDINVDYSNFNNFVFFGSSYQRVYNFYNKVKEIEDYKNFITSYTPFISTTASLQTTINQYSASINNIIAEFDGYEYYLYYESSSYAWPKSGSFKPFSLLSTGSATVVTWYNNLTGFAKDYDLNNYDNLEYAVPLFVKDDTTNQPFLLFLNMVGHYFDNIWIYLKAVTDINLANNNLDYGISRDLVYQQLKSLGIKLYNSQAGDSVDNYLIGANTGSVVWDNNFTITGSYLNNIPRKDLVAELYKRIYHNLPLLIKTKGTVAGLDNLMTVFGIPNRTYYTVGSESFYTPTGSSSTSSILNVKEFGGSLKSNLVDGYNNDKVRIVSNNIVSGSVLSPLLSLQEYPTSSAAFRDDDLHYVDISFSPQTQIDTHVSKSIAATNPTWSLDDYIGDPGQLYSGSYPDLDAQRKLYFETGVPGGLAPFTASLLDYNGFIRLIEFFDNSLFKMLNDFVPERTSLSTGVTINSPVLERNKAAYSKPTVTTQSVHEANYDVAGISSQYGTFYNALSSSNNTMGWYDGELSGSVVDVNQYFEDNYNPYLQPTSSLTPTDINFFNHSDWNVLLNNVSKSVDSQYRKRIEYFYGTTSSLTHSAELQDSYLSLRSYNTSRYEGSKITSLLLNTYTSASYTGSDGFTIQSGDKSFGKTAVIDRNSLKVGWVKNFQSQSLNFFDKTSITLKYLVDENQNLIELNQRNSNLFEVQNIFKSGERVVVSLSDLVKPSFQKTLDGTKTIFKGGFSYDPILFRENFESLTFRYLNPSSSVQIPVTYRANSFGYNWAFPNSEYTYNNNFTYQTPDKNSVNPNASSALGYSFISLTSDQVKSSTTTFDPDQWLKEGQPMSFRSYNENQWNTKISNVTQKNLINYAFPITNIGDSLNYRRPGGTTNNERYSRVYTFDVLDFDSITTNTTQRSYNTLTENGKYLYVSNTNNDHTVKLKIPFLIFHYFKTNSTFGLTKQSMEEGGFYTFNWNFKVFGFLEKIPADQDATEDNNWQIIAVARTNYTDKDAQAGGGYTAPPITLGSSDYGNYWIGRNFATSGLQYYQDQQAAIHGYVELFNPTDPSKSEITVPLNAGDKLRFRFCFLDYNGFFGTKNYSPALPDSDGAAVLHVVIGKYPQKDITFNHPAVPTGNGISEVPYRSSGWKQYFPNLSTAQDNALFEITDPSSTVTIDQFDQTIASDVFEPDAVEKSTVFIGEDYIPAILGSASFIPSTSSVTYTNYTPVIDEFSIQAGDLIRVGEFTNTKSTYFTVIKSEFINPFSGSVLSNQSAMYLYNADMAKKDMTISDTSMSATKNRSTITVLATTENKAFFDAVNLTTGTNAKQFRLTNAYTEKSPTNIPFTSGIPSTYTIKEIKEQELLYFPNATNYIISPQQLGTPQKIKVLRIAVSDEGQSSTFPWGNNPVGVYDRVSNYTNPSLGYNLPTTFNSWAGKDNQFYAGLGYTNGFLIVSTFESVTPLESITYIKVTLDREIPSGLQINEDFAILRPKPDETSVIIDYKKQNGNVSQTILIPFDASNTLKNKVGDIFASLNVDLTNTNDSQLP